MAGKQETQTTTGTSEPWKPQQSHIKFGMNEAKDLYNSAGPKYFPKSTVAGFSKDQKTAFKTIRADAKSDPFAGRMMKRVKQQVMPSVNSNFMDSGRYGSGMHADTMTRAMTEAYTPYAIDTDRYNQEQLMNIGGMQQQMAQAERDDAKSRFDFYQDLPANRLGQYMGFTGGNYGGTTTSSTPYYKPSVFGQAAGGLAGLAGLLL
jgi:hypothetical protein